MDWLLTLDTNLFRWINRDLAGPLLDYVMPFLSSNKFFFPVVLALGVLLIWKGRLRGLVCVLMLALIVSLGDGAVCRTLKEAVGRPRPFLVLPEVHLLVGKGGSASMPSSHAANWFAATMIFFIYYRRSLWLMLPGALLVSFSRIYNGVHYPSDVLAGAILGAGYAAAGVWSLDALWKWAGRKWFPLWWERFPSLMDPPERLATTDAEEEGQVPPRDTPSSVLPPRHVSPDAHWLRLGYVWIAVLLLARLAYIASGIIQLSGDEAYQWVWSKHLALSYYSKPPLIAYTQFLGTFLWGDTAFGVRFFSPVIAALIGIITLRFFAREVNARAGFFLLLIVTATPLLSVGAVLMTIDPLSVLFWTAAMFAGWRAVQERSTTKDWAWVGLWMGFGFLSKYTGLVQLLSWALFFALWRPARKQLLRPGPYVALGIHAICALPVLIWNSQHGWITVRHVAETGGAGRPWHPTLKYFLDFVGSEFGLLNPVFCVAMVWAMIMFWRRFRHHPLMTYFFSMGVPVIVIYTLQSARSRILPNWIAPAVLPLFCLMVIYWDMRWRLGVARIKGWLVTGLVLGFTMVLVGHDTNLIPRLLHYRLPVNLDPLHRVREWDETAKVIGQVRDELLTEGKPVFIILQHYSMTGEVSFYLPEAKAGVLNGSPIAYYQSSEVPENQFYFWPGYTDRKGENAIYVTELDRDDPVPEKPPIRLQSEFDSITDLGVRNVMYEGRLVRPLQFFACRGLK